MSDQSRNGGRPLRTEEESLIRALLGGVDGSEKLLDQLECALVHDMDDSGWGVLGSQVRNSGLWAVAL